MEPGSPLLNGTGNKVHRLPPFVRKLVNLTKSCPSDVGAWSEDGSQFVVKSSRFADVIQENFDSSLQTFLRQLHFYSFKKKDEDAFGVWAFYHPSFRYGQPHLLEKIQRKPTSKVTSKQAPTQDVPTREVELSLTGEVELSLESIHYGLQEVAQRLNEVERYKDVLDTLKLEIETLKQQLLDMNRVAAAENLLSLVPRAARKRVITESSTPVSVQPVSDQAEDIGELNMSSASDSPALRKRTHVASVDSELNLRNLPPDYSIGGSECSESDYDVIGELQNDFFSDFDLFLSSTAASAASVSFLPAGTPVFQNSSKPDVDGICKARRVGSLLNVPEGFVLKSGVTIPLLKCAFNVMAQRCGPAGSQHCVCSEPVKKICRELAHPSRLPSIEQCDLTREVLPTLRAEIADDSIPDVTLMNTIRQIYEIYYATMRIKLQGAVLVTSTGEPTNNVT